MDSKKLSTAQAIFRVAHSIYFVGCSPYLAEFAVPEGMARWYDLTDFLSWC